MKFTDAVLPLAVIAVVALGAYFVLGDKMIANEVEQIDTEVQVDSPEAAADNEAAGVAPEASIQEEEAPSGPATEAIEAQAREEEAVETATDVVTQDLNYDNGTYTVNTSYSLPNGGSHDMEVTMTLENDAVQDVSIVFDGDISGGSTPNQERFVEAMGPLVIGMTIDDIALSRIGGSSLTTNGFNDALELVKGQAQS